jgi:hypothetical protein
VRGLIEGVYRAERLNTLQEMEPEYNGLRALRNKPWKHLMKQRIALASLYEHSGTE